MPTFRELQDSRFFSIRISLRAFHHWKKTFWINFDQFWSVLYCEM